MMKKEPQQHLNPYTWTLKHIRNGGNRMVETDFILKALELKEQERAWIEMFQIEESESVADHSWSVAFLSILFSSEADINVEKVLKMVIVHDLAEAEIGDYANRKKDEDREISSERKKQIEEDAWDRFDGMIDNEELKDLWREYERRETQEAKFVKDMDLLDLCLQALKYERNDQYAREEIEFENLEGVFQNSRERLQTELGKQLFEKIYNRYESAEK
ncbi:HD domain-containing protein [Nanohaloarchaea archaeon H01]|nr:HD domain-containing protein [Nanohaloarchaea archaeon H01]